MPTYETKVIIAACADIVATSKARRHSSWRAPIGNHLADDPVGRRSGFSNRTHLAGVFIYESALGRTIRFGHAALVFLR